MKGKQILYGILLCCAVLATALTAAAQDKPSLEEKIILSNGTYVMNAHVVGIDPQELVSANISWSLPGTQIEKTGNVHICDCPLRTMSAQTDAAYFAEWAKRCDVSVIEITLTVKTKASGTLEFQDWIPLKI